MGTLFNQKERDHENITEEGLSSFLGVAARLAEKHKVSVSDVIAAKHALELERQNKLSVRSGDTLDEQLAGFGELLRDLLDVANGIIERKDVSKNKE